MLMLFHQGSTTKPFSCWGSFNALFFFKWNSSHVKNLLRVKVSNIFSWMALPPPCWLSFNISNDMLMLYFHTRKTVFWDAVLIVLLLSCWSYSIKASLPIPLTVEPPLLQVSYFSSFGILILFDCGCFVLWFVLFKCWHVRLIQCYIADLMIS